MLFLYRALVDRDQPGEQVADGSFDRQPDNADPQVAKMVATRPSPKVRDCVRAIIPGGYAFKELWYYSRDHDLQDRNDKEAIWAGGKYRIAGPLRQAGNHFNSNQATSSRIWALQAFRSSWACPDWWIAPSGRHPCPPRHG